MSNCSSVRLGLWCIADPHCHTHTPVLCCVLVQRCSLLSCLPVPVVLGGARWGQRGHETGGYKHPAACCEHWVQPPSPNQTSFCFWCCISGAWLSKSPPCLSSCFEGYGALQHPMSLVVVHSFRHLQWELGVAPLMPPLSPPKEMRDGAEAYYIGDNTKQQTYRTCIVTVGGPNMHHKPSLTKVCFDVIPVRIHVELKLGLIQPCTLVYGL